MRYVIPQRVLDRFWQRVDCGLPDECWPYKLSRNPAGYGQVSWREPGRNANRLVGAHRVAWVAEHGPIPGDLTVDHLCRNRACCNPRHLRLLTLSENSRLTSEYLKTHCKHGHEFNSENTYWRRDRPGQRLCRACKRQRRADAEAQRMVVKHGLHPVSFGYGREIAEDYVS